MAKKSLFKYRAAVIGCGRIGLLADLTAGLMPKPATHAGAFLAHPRIRLAGLADVDSAKRRKAKELLPDIPVFGSAEELLQKVKPDIVSVATPDETHWPVVRLAAEHGARLLICEKPIAATLADAQKIINVCKRRGAILLVNHMRRFDPLLIKFQKMINTGKLGRIRQVRCLYVNGLLNAGTHAIDLIRWFAGEFISVQGGQYNKGLSFTHSDDYNADGLLELQNGARVVLQPLEKNDYYIWDIEFYGSKGALFVRDLGFRMEVIPVIPGQTTAGFNKLSVRDAESFGRERSLLAPIAEHAVACLDGKTEPASTGEDALAALKVLLALRRSAEHDGRKEIV